MPARHRTRKTRLLLLLAAAALIVGGPPAAARDRAETAPAAGTLTLREALAMGLARNFALQVETLEVPIAAADTIIEEARFDPALEASGATGYERTPTASAFSTSIYDTQRITSGEAGIRKSFPFGLESRLAFETERLTNNSAVTGLRPQYRSFLVFDLSQPLLRGFGQEVNTVDLRLARNQRRQAAYDFLSQAQGLGAEIETLYYDLARVLAVLRFRQESLALARELLAANRRKLDAGLIPITEVQEAETAVAAREEDTLLAEQELATNFNRLENLLAIRTDSPLRPEPFRVEPLPEPAPSHPGFEAALADALANRPDLERARLEIRNRNIRLAFFANQKLPRLDLDATLGVNGLSGEARQVAFADFRGTSAFTGDYFDSVDRMANGDGYEWFAGLTFSYPLGNRAAEARYRRADLEKRQAIYGFQQLENEIVTGIKNGLVAVESSLARLAVARRFERLAATTLEQEMARLQEGLSDTFRVLDFQEGVINARIRSAAALANYHQGLAGLYRAMGLNLQRHDIVPRFMAAESSNR
jgi:outer membrane protein TolC